MPERLLVPIPEAMQLLCVGRSKFYALVNSGELRVVKIGRRSYIKAEALKAFVDGLPELIVG